MPRVQPNILQTRHSNFRQEERILHMSHSGLGSTYSVLPCNHEHPLLYVPGIYMHCGW